MQLISVIIPAYNCAAFLPAAIQSALDQTYPRIEIVVVNDGSPDNTNEVVQPYLDRIVYIQQKNKGLSGARNVGFRSSHGEYICFLDADDTLLPEKFEKQMAVFGREPDLGVVISGFIFVTEDGNTNLQTVYKSWHRDALAHLLNHEVFPPHAPLIRRSILDASSLFPEDIITAESQEDWQLWLGLALNGVQFSSVPEPLCNYRRRQGSISSYPFKHLDGARRVVGWLRQHPKGKRYRRQIERLAGIVEMERAARAWQAGQTDLAVETFEQAVKQNPVYWMEPNTWLRFFTTSLCFEDSVKWVQKPDPEWYKKTVLERYLVDVREGIPRKTFRKLSATAWLMLDDLIYGTYDDEMRINVLKKAWNSDWITCFSVQGFPLMVRAFLGPRVIDRVKNRKIHGEEK